MKSYAILLVFLGCCFPALQGCDPAYRYVFYPEQREEITLLPDTDLQFAAGDTSYSISRDSLSVVFDRRSYKVEVKYLSDYQLNTTEFPNESKDAEFSPNPFTYADWVDPDLGYTPSRFSVFKVSIYNYTSSKINFDPELSELVSDRGDVLPGYGREEKSSKNQSLEAYFKKRKGSSGVDDDVFERRMGIIRTNVLYLGKPIYQGDSREGLVVLDPLHESVQKVKLTMKNFIVGYDENNEPNEFVTIHFYFKKAPLAKEKIKPRIAAVDTSVSVSMQNSPLREVEFEICQIRYRVESAEEAGIQEDWNQRPKALPNLVQFLQDSLKAKPRLRISSPESSELVTAPLAFLLAGSIQPLIGDFEMSVLSSMLKEGGVLVIDNAVFPTGYQYSSFLQQVLEGLASKMGRGAKVQSIPKDHEIYRAWRALSALPEGQDNFENMPEKRDYLQGLFVGEKLVALGSTKGYSMVWERHDSRNTSQFTLGANLVVYALRTRALRP